MKKLVATTVFALATCFAFAQTGSGFGIKGGLNYNQNGDLTYQQAVDAGTDIIRGSEGKAGYHIGVFGKLDFPKLYIRPEVVYTQTKSSYAIATGMNAYDITKIDAPILLGYKLIGPLHVFAGPAFQYILENELEDVTIEGIENDFSIGLHAGIGVSFGNFGFDVRYERGFSENEANFIGNNITDISGMVDTRPSQIIASLSLKL